MLLRLRKLSTVALIIAIASTGFAAGFFVGYNIGYDACPAATMTVVRIGYLMADIHHTPFFVAFSKGFYESEAILPKRLEYANGPAEMMALSAGDLDAGYVGVVPALMAKAKGVDLVILASANLEGSALVSKREVNSIPELNKKIVGTPGIGTIQDCLLYILEKKFNITVTHQHYKVSDLPTALAKGEVDAYIAWEPFATEAFLNGIGRMLCTSHEILPNHQCCVFYVSGRIYRENPDLLRKLIRVHIKAMRFINVNKTDSMKIFSDTTGKPLEIVEESWGNMVWDVFPNVASMKRFTSYLLEQGKINPEDVQDIDKFIDDVFPLELMGLLEEMEKAG